MYQRVLKLPTAPKHTFFLWGPRQTGKSSLLRVTYPNTYKIDLLKSEEYISLTSQPETLRERLLHRFKGEKSRVVIIDEFQRVPALLNEVHYLIEEHGFVFILCGSSARKLRKGHGNLLGGRAMRYSLGGLVSEELKEDFDLEKILNFGTLPRIYQMQSWDREARPALRAYCSDYLKEEIFAESLVRKLPEFTRFLSAAALSDGEIVSWETFARDCGVSAPAVRNYFEILEDTLIGHFLNAYTHRPKRRTVASPKFYFFDVGIVNQLAERGYLKPKSELFGKAFENWVCHELRRYLESRVSSHEMYYWRLTTAVEVDFIIGKMRYAIEAKATTKVTSDHLKGLREVHKDYPQLKRRVVVSLVSHSRLTEDGIEILNYNEFCKLLWSDQLIE